VTPYRISLLLSAKMGWMEEALRILNETLAQIERTGAKGDQAEMLRIKGYWADSCNLTR